MRRLSNVGLKNCVIGLCKYGVIGNSLSLEASSICQLKCPECSQAKGNVGIIGKGYLRFHDFKTFVEKHPHFKKIELSNYGEIFLNPELKDIIRYAHDAGIKLTARNGVNFNTVDDEMLEILVKYQFQKISVSIDGATPDTYAIYRKGGHLLAVLENIRKINTLKQHYHSIYPALDWQFILFGHNEHELPLARKMASDLNMRFKLKLNWSTDYSPPQHENGSLLQEIGGITRQDYQHKTQKMYMAKICTQLWFAPQINWDGKVLGCCVNKWGDFGNAFETPLQEILKSKKYRSAKGMVLGLKKHDTDVPCYYCNHYQNMQKMGKFLLSQIRVNDFFKSRWT